MVQINFAQKQVNAKIVYYGPGMSGKTTNLEVIHQRAPEGNRGDLTSISTDGDRTLFFDFMPLDLGTVAGMRTCFQIYTVPGQVYYNSTRKLVLQGVDGVIFVADSSPDMMEENIESMKNLEANLIEYGRSIEELPLVIQYNKRDIEGALPIEELEEQLNTRGAPAFEGIANTGQGVFPTLKAVAACVLDSLHKQQSSAGGQPAAAAPPPAAPVSAPPAAEEVAAAPQPIEAAAPEPPAPAPAPAPEPETASPAERATISMSQTGFHRAPSVPLPKPEPQAAAPPEEVQPEASPPQPAQPAASASPAGELRMAPPPKPAAPVGEAPAGGSGLQMAAKPQSFRPPEAPAMQPVQPQAAAPPPQPAQPPQTAPQPVADPGAMATQEAPPPPPPPTPGSMMRSESSSSVPQRRTPSSNTFRGPASATPASAPRPTPQIEKSKKSAVLTAVIIVVSVAVGAALGSFVLSIL